MARESTGKVIHWEKHLSASMIFAPVRFCTSSRMATIYLSMARSVTKQGEGHASGRSLARYSFMALGGLKDGRIGSAGLHVGPRQNAVAQASVQSFGSADVQGFRAVGSAQACAGAQGFPLSGAGHRRLGAFPFLPRFLRRR